MNLQKINDINYLKELSQNHEALNKEITDSKGYVLHVMEKNKIFPSLGYFIDNLNAFSIFFVVTNYDLNRSQIKKIRTFFNEGVENKVTKDVLSKDEVIEYLKNGDTLPRNTVLDFNVIRNNYKEITIQYERSEYNAHDIMKQSLKGVSVEDFLSLDEEFLKENLQLFNINRQLFKNKLYNQRYKELVVKRALENGDEPSLRSFKNYIFHPDDKSFLESLLQREKKNRYSINPYSEYMEYRGFEDLISKVDYFQRYNNRNLKSFTEKEIENNIDLIRTIFLNNLRENSYESFKELAHLDVNLEHLNLIVDNEFMKSFLQKISVAHIGYVDKDHTEAVNRFNSLRFKFLNYLATEASEDIYDKIDFKDVIKNINEIANNNNLINEPGFKENIVKFYDEKLVILLKSTRLEQIYSEPQLITGKTYNLIENLAEKNPSINFLTLLLNHHATRLEMGYSSDAADVTGIINNMMSKLDKQSVEIISKRFNYNIPEEVVLLTQPQGSYEINLLNHKVTKLEEMSDLSISMLLGISEEFRERILDEKKILEYKFLQPFLTNATDKDNMEFLVKYFEVNKETVLTDKSLIRTISSHPLGKKMIQLDSKNYEEDDYQEFLLKLKELNILEINEKTQGDKYYETPEYKIYQEKHRAKQEEINELKGGLSFDFLAEKIQFLLKDRNFEEYSIMKKNYLVADGNEKFFINNVNSSSFDILLKNIENKHYVNLLEGSIDYNNKTEIMFKKFKPEQNQILAELLSNQFKEKTKPLNFFKPENRGFINDFLIKNMPLEMFYSYNLRPSVGKNNFRNENSLVNVPYTSEQLIKGFNKADKIGFFSVRDANASYNDLFQENFINNELKFKEFLDLTKQTNHKLYALLSHRNIFKNFKPTEKENKITQDEFQANYFKENFDIDTLLKGFKIVIDEIKDSKNKAYGDLNHKLAFSSVQSFIHSTYHDKMNAKHDSEYFSPLEDSQKHKIIDFLFKEVSFYTLSQHRIGDVKVPEYIAENFIKYSNEESIIDKVLIPNETLRCEYFSLGDRGDKNRFNGYVDTVITGMINHYIAVGAKEEIDYISYLIKDSERCEQLSYDFQTKETNINREILNFISTNEEIKEKLNISSIKFSLDEALREKPENKIKTSRRKI